MHTQNLEWSRESWSNLSRTPVFRVILDILFEKKLSFQSQIARYHYHGNRTSVVDLGEDKILRIHEGAIRTPSFWLFKEKGDFELELLLDELNSQIHYVDFLFHKFQSRERGKPRGEPIDRRFRFTFDWKQKNFSAALTVSLEEMSSI